MSVIVLDGHNELECCVIPNLPITTNSIEETR